MSAVNFNTQELALMNNNFIVPKYTNVQYTTIQNRAQVLDASNMLQAVMGVERIPFRGINLLQKEFGANGEPVYELESKDARVRFVGSWIAIQSSSGLQLYSLTLDSFAEITFYGTGLNLMSFSTVATGDFRVTIDNDVEGGNIYATTSAILTGRSYNPNVVRNIASGLSLGTHTIKLRVGAAGTTNGCLIMGIEILNQSTSLSISPGQAFVGNKKEYLSTLVNSAYNAGVVGTKGARVSKYLLNGVVSQAVQECAATPSYLTNTNHIDEEVVRRVNYKEFGANRADDFSTLSTARAAAFTLDDGTTTLVSNSADGTASGVISLSSNGTFVTLTFIGTGLDITQNDSGNGGSDSYTVSIDGATAIAMSSTGNTSSRTVKICSGLPYGTHTVKFTRVTAVTWGMSIGDFIIYQPKKPVLPIGAIEVADYCVMADYSNGIISGNIDALSSGVLHKQSIREMVYVGSWSAGQTGTVIGGWYANSATTGNYVEYSFYGTGLNIIGSANVGGTNTIQIDGTNYTGSASAIGAGSSWVSGTSIWTPSSTNGSGLILTGLALGLHKVRITLNNVNGYFHHAIHVVTPIHINHPTLKIGSLSLFNNDMIQASALPVSGPDLSKAKAWVVYDQVNSKILGSLNITQVLANGAGVSIIYFSKPFKNGNYALIAGSAHYQTTANITDSQKCRIVVSDSGGVSANSIFSLACYGELQDE